jgi:hypothetical protein
LEFTQIDGLARIKPLNRTRGFIDGGAPASGEQQEAYVLIERASRAVGESAGDGWFDTPFRAVFVLVAAEK